MPSFPQLNEIDELHADMDGDECYQRLLIMLFPQSFVTSFMSCPSYLIELIDLIVARIRTSNVWFSDCLCPI
jgi:hypothetical protein